MKKPTVKVVQNIWGNYVCFVGKERVTDYGVAFDAKCWLATKIIKDGCKVSAKSDFSEADVEDWKQYVD